MQSKFNPLFIPQDVSPLPATTLINKSGPRKNLKKPAVAIDMINVGWGDCFLLHLIEPNAKNTYRILIDGGTQSNNPLTQLRDRASYSKINGKIPIDLLIGSHYDQDHLEGLATVVASNEFLIKEAWLPPVIDESSVDHPSTDPNLQWLAKRFIDGEEDEIAKYLEEYGEKSGEIELINKFLKHAMETLPEKSREMTEEIDEKQEKDQRRNLERALEEIVVIERNRKSGGIENVKKLIEMTLEYRPQRFGLSREQVEAYEKLLFADDMLFVQSFLRPFPQIFDDLSMYNIRIGQTIAAVNLSIVKSRAHGAITAIYLDKLVKALKNEGVSMKMPISGDFSNTIWAMTATGWSPISGSSSADFFVTHMSPTKQIINRLIDKIPRIHFMFLISPSVTASNQLSHVTNIHFHNYAILMTGDSGFDEFPTSRPKNPKENELLDEIADAQVIKVPHHAGSYNKFGRTIAQITDMKNKLRYIMVTTGQRPRRSTPRPEFTDLIIHLRNHQKVSSKVLFSNPPQSGLFKACPNCKRANKINQPFIRLEGKAGRWTLETIGVCCSELL